MQVITIDEQFRYLLPVLDEQTYQLLEESLLEHGCRDPLVLWNGILIDGNNRYRICMEHDIPFNTVNMEFDSREEVIIWIITNQISRRNLTSIQLSYFRGLHYITDKGTRGGDQRPLAKSEIPTLNSGSTSRRLAEQYRVSRDTIIVDSKLADAIDSIGAESPEAKRKILSGEISINKSKLEALSSAENEEIAAVAAEIEAGTYMRRAPRTPISEDILPEIRQQNEVIRGFASTFNSMFQQINNGGSVELKTVLRSYIDELEDLYRNI